MDLLKELLHRERFNRFSFGLVIVSILAGFILFGVLVTTETNEETYSFICRIKGEDKDFFKRTCFADYLAKTTRGFALYGFVLLYVALVTLVSVFYSLSVKVINESQLQQDQERIRPNQSVNLYCRYCIQLAIRSIVGIIFLILQWGVFYPVHFPSEYTCDLTHIHQTKLVNTTRGAGNITRFWYDCYNPQADSKTLLNIIVFIFIVLFTVFILVELIYVITKALVNKDFMKEFFKIHLLSQNGRLVMDNGRIDKNFLVKLKKNIEENTKFYEPLLPNIPGEEQKILELDKIYTNVILYHGRAKCEFSRERHEIVEGYLKSQEQHKSINKVEEIFAPKPGNQQLQERPLSIMIIGRPGIGKSLLCQKILRDWACGKAFKEETQEGKRFEFVCLFKFRYFNNDGTMTLQQMLRKGQDSGTLPKEVYNWILSHSEKVLLIFDGLDEFGKKKNILNEERYESRLEEEIPFSALYAKLTLGKLLKGATVVTTSRPTALSYVSFPKRFDRCFEVLGFKYEGIKEYIARFCQDSNVHEKIWNHISSNGNLLSLCYIPVTCHILCFSLRERLKQNEGNVVDYLPTTLTEIYEDALIVIVCKHNPKYRNNVAEQQKLLHSRDFPPEVKQSLESLGKVAYRGIEDDRLIFEKDEVKEHEESGLLHRLPNKQVGAIQRKEQYCFLHLTIQEFLAAKYIVALKKGDSKDMESWISEHLRQGKWEVVMQFVAGLLHDKDNSVIEIYIKSLPKQTSGQESWPSGSKADKNLITFKCIFEFSRNLDNGWRELIRSKLSGVVNVNLSGLSLTDADLTSIVFVLQEAKNIASLIVKRNNITSTGCLEIHKLLKMQECKLTTLDISYNKIGDDGVKHLSNLLTLNQCQMTTLDISGNEISYNGVKHLCDVLSSNECKLTTLYISGNRLGDEGLQHLSHALSKSECKLTGLDISDNDISVAKVKDVYGILFIRGWKLTATFSDIKGNEKRINGFNALPTGQFKLTMLQLRRNLNIGSGLENLGYDGTKH